MASFRMRNRLLLLTSMLIMRISAAQETRTLFSSYHSQLLNRDVAFYILLPFDYDSTSERYPVLYMFRGAAAEWITPFQDAPRGNRELRSIIDTLRRRRTIGKMIYVLPDMSAPATGQEIAAVATEMYAHIDSNFRTIPTRWHRGVDGFSYGGLDAMNLVSYRPDALCTAGAYDGSYFAYDMSKILNADSEEVRKLARIRYLQHSGEGGNTNQANVLLLVQALNSKGISNEFADPRLAPGAQHNWWYADEHMLVTLPLHWDTFSHAPRSIQTQILTPGSGEKISGSYMVTWSLSDAPASANEDVEYSSDRGKTWHSLYTGSASVTSYLWNTAAVADGAWYLLRLLVAADTAYGETTLASPFTIDNPGDGAPLVEIISPLPETTISGLTMIQWLASDPEDDSLSFTLELETSAGVTPIASGLRGVTVYSWDSRQAPNAASAVLRINASDGQRSTLVSSNRLTIANTRVSLPSPVQHIAGRGDGTISPHVVNPAALIEHTYRITFSDSANKANRVHIRDLDKDSILVDGAPIIGSGNEGPEFDGLRLEISQPDFPEYSSDSSRWLSGQSNLYPSVTIPTLTGPGGSVSGVRIPEDYFISVFDHVVDTSANYFGYPPSLMMFTVRKVSDGEKVPVLYADFEGDAQISLFDEIVILEPQQGADPLLTWDLFFPSVTSPMLPRAGDVFFLRILKPFTANDTLEFMPLIEGFPVSKTAQRPDQLVLFQNYPNPFNPSTAIEFDIPRQDRVTVTIYNVLGQAVASLLDATMTPGRHRVLWNAATVASGVYFVRVSAGRQVALRKMLLLR
jgi:enterochelin esterase-like enzyme